MDEITILSEPRPSRADALKNRELLLRTAAELTAQRGIEAVSMSDIAEAAGVGKGTLYRHFRSKTDICLALLNEDQRNLQERTLARLRENHDPLDNLRWFLGEVLTFVWDHLPLLYMYEGERSAVTLIHPAHIWWRQTIHGLLTQLHPTGDIDYLTDVLYVLLDAHTIHFQLHSLGYDETRIRNGLISTLTKLINA